jgi:hypothetical protein
MRQTRNRLVIPALAAGLVFSSIWASDHICRTVTCDAYKIVGGELQKTVFARGDIVSTESGWIVSQTLGWDQLN